MSIIKVLNIKTLEFYCCYNGLTKSNNMTEKERENKIAMK